MSTEDQKRTEEKTAEEWRQSLGWDYQDLHDAGKRCGLVWAPWMGDWFTSHSPRNDNSHAEGYWDHWVDLALMILRDPLTKIVRPGAYEAAMAHLPEPVDFYDGCGRALTDEELMARFATPQPEGTQPNV